ncbi:nuclear transport factor 2 family protein [Citrobacter koseri]|nr:nuclear transport factor 2 family protein [Citrobacter koseri]
MTNSNEIAKADRNKTRIHEFYEKIYNGHDLTALVTFISENYTDHNPYIKGGRSALEAFLKHIFHVLPKIEFSIERLVAENDFVVAHTMMRKTPSDSGSMIAEFFRLEDGIIVERWDVTMRVPNESNSEQPLI